MGSVKPINYAISLYDLELGGEYGYQGTVKVDLNVLRAAKEIVLNAHELKIHSAQIHSTQLSRNACSRQWFMLTGTDQETKDISYDEKAQRVTLRFSDEISPTNHATLEIRYSGVINNKMAGFYRSKYKPAVAPAPSVPHDGGYHYMFSTQFESCDARRAFPCFDEPNLKATFDLEIEIPEDQTALSNMPEKATRAGKEGRKVVSFEQTPIMSTYVR
jgi:aminopeptidase N